MANRILIINNENAQELPMNVMDRFQQVMLVVSKGQNNLPVEVVSQLLMAQAQLKVQIELLALKNTNKPTFDLHFAMHLGRLVERNPDGQFTILSPDNSLDPLIISCKEQGIRINRVEALQRLSAVQGNQELSMEPADLSAEPEASLNREPQTKAAAAAAAAALEPTAEPESASSRNHRLISSLIGGNQSLGARG